MSLFSRLFRKAPASLPPENPPQSLEPPRPAPNVPDRALVAAREEAELQAAIEARDAGTVGRLVLEGTSTRIRQQAAQAVEDPAQLRQLIKDVRGGNDKSVYRILTRKRDACWRRRVSMSCSRPKSRPPRRPSSDTVTGLTMPCSRRLWSSSRFAGGRRSGCRARPSAKGPGRYRPCARGDRPAFAADRREASRELAAANAAAEAQRSTRVGGKSRRRGGCRASPNAEAAERKARAEKRRPNRWPCARSAG